MAKVYFPDGTARLRESPAGREASAEGQAGEAGGVGGAPEHSWARPGGGGNWRPVKWRSLPHPGDRRLGDLGFLTGGPEDGGLASLHCQYSLRRGGGSQGGGPGAALSRELLRVRSFEWVGRDLAFERAFPLVSARGER